VYEALFLTSNPTCTKAALNLLGHGVGGLRLPLVEASPQELAAVRATLERHGLLGGGGEHAHAEALGSAGSSPAARA
jgi:4-hydroxy-tetrahydrodipicolinate synthase